MTTIVMNTLSGAVTEYDWAFQSITPLRAGSNSGLHTLGGNTDGAAEIDAEIQSRLIGGKKRLLIDAVYVALQGEGEGVVTVHGLSQTWEYPMQIREHGVSRVKPGKGIYESYLGVGYRNVAGADFRIDRLDADIIESTHRRL